MIREFYRADTVEQALNLKQQNPGAAWLAGGTELVSFSRDRVSAVIDIGGLPLKEIRETADGGLEMGALTTLETLASAAFTDPRLGAVGRAAACLRNRNIRNMATVGGNLGTRKASSDLIPVLLILQAEAVTAGPDGATRSMPLQDWLSSTDQSLLLSLKLPAPAENDIVLVRSFTRVACDLALVNGAARIRVDSGRITSLTAALGCLAGQTVVLDLTDSVGGTVDEPALAAVLRQKLAAVLEPRDDHRASGGYRLDLAAVLVSEMAVAALREGREAK